MSDSSGKFFHFCKKSEVWYCLAASAVAGALGAIACAHLYKPSFCERKEEKSKATKKFHLKYWNGRGLMEVARTMLALKGVECNDGRYTTETNEDRKHVLDIATIANTLDCNLGRMPALTVDDSIHIGQSAAINFYIAAEIGMMGSSNEEAALIISIKEHLAELSRAKTWAYDEQPTEKALIAFFEEGPTEASGIPDSKQRSKRALGWYLARLEKIVGSVGFAVGSQFSLADALIYNLLGETLKGTESAETVPKYRREPCGDAARMTKALAAHPNLLRIVNNYRSGISEYLTSRGLQMF